MPSRISDKEVARLRRQNLLEFGILLRGDHGNHSLMRLAARQAVKLLAGNESH